MDTSQNNNEIKETASEKTAESPVSTGGRKEAVLNRLAAHPYIMAFVLCMVLTPFCFGGLNYVPSYAVPVTAILLAAVSAFLIARRCYRAHSPIHKYVLWLSAAGAAAAVGSGAYLRSENKAAWIMLGGSWILLAVYSLVYNEKIKHKLNSMLIIGLGFMMKLSYVLGTSVYSRQHDNGEFTLNELRQGHLGYIAYLYQNHHLYPEDYRQMLQYCHPPFHHTISAVWVYIMHDIFRIEISEAVESIQMLTLFYSVTIVISAYYIFRYFGLEGRNLYIPLAITSFHPCFTFLASLINNDPLMWALVMGAMVNTLKWYREPSLKRIMYISLCIGPAMMTKVSAALVAPPVAIVFLAVFIRDIKTSWKKLLGQFISFGAVCIPLGMWFPVRGLVKFGIPLNYVQELPKGLEQDISGISFVKRITDLSPVQFRNVFENWYSGEKAGSFNEQNPLIAILKNSIFSEFIRESNFDNAKYMLPVCRVLFWLGVFIAAAALAAMIYTFVKDKTMNWVCKVFFGSFYLLLVGNLYIMSAKYPLVCTMNFRYLMPAVIIGSLFIGMALRRLSSRKVQLAAGAAAAVFSVLSAAVYTSVVCL